MQRILIIFLMLFSFSLLANEINNDVTVLKEGEVILNTIDKLTKDGYITEKNAKEAKKQYVFDNPELLHKVLEVKNNSEKEINNEVSWTDYITLTNSLYFIASVFVIIACFSWIKLLIKSGLSIILLVPVPIYQIILLGLSLTMSFKPELLSVEYSFYLAFIGSMTNLFIVGWIAAMNQDIFERILKIFSLGLNIETIANFWLFLYFGLFTVMYESQAFGLLSVIFFVAMTGFIIVHFGLGIALGAKERNMLLPVVVSNLLVLGSYSFVTITGITIPYLMYFSVGIQYACSLALCVCLLIISSPFFKEEDEFPIGFILMLIVSALGFYAGNIYGLDVIAAFTNTFFVLFMIEWFFYSVHKAHYSIILILAAAALYGVAELLLKYPELFVTSLI